MSGVGAAAVCLLVEDAQDALLIGAACGLVLDLGSLPSPPQTACFCLPLLVCRMADLRRTARAAAFAGRVSPAAKAAARAAGVELLDCFEREDLALLNAVPTAEGCLALLMEYRPRTIWHSPILVLGYGRVGQAVARRLTALGAYTTVAARSAAQRALALADGAASLPLDRMEEALPQFDAVVNTIPAPVLTAGRLLHLRAGALILDLASRPGGTDFAAARQQGLTALHALSLPARCAPETAVVIAY